ncbi:toxin-antitoxin system YwqK family antitoxin [Runella sp. SP2]|uniref:toxin-antitoxin system YwqK family antitoxin n=1 Tax=Runella sp. SP2 TaxID=2268026 RepID=UPI000F090516|nr:hypothetical protein [Runella sp. SP2]AYQ33293.1 hypothetical protein DTQ70_14490 [Runella sp. SP2]
MGKKVSLLLVILWGITLQTIQASFPDSLQRAVIRREFVDHDEELTFHDRKKRFATLKTYNKQGTLLSETNFKDYQAGIRQGFSKGFYPTGQLYWIADYRNNDLWGEMRVYHENGELKRRETYWAGLLKEKHCYNEEGGEIDYYPFSEAAAFPGGDYAFQAYLRSKLKDLHIGSETSLFTFELHVQADSVVVLRQFSKSEKITLPRMAEIIKDMPKWLPAHYDKVPQDDIVVVNLVFKRGMVYLSNLTLDFAGANHKKGSNSAQTKDIKEQTQEMNYRKQLQPSENGGGVQTLRRRQ